MGPTIFILLTVLFCATSAYYSVQKPFAFQCSPGYSINSIKAVYKSAYRDRQYEFGCRATSYLTSSCSWSSNANQFQGFLIYQCPANHLLSGIISQHSSTNRDRRFQFYCCRLSGKKTTSCSYSSRANYFTGSLSHSVSSSYVLKGVISVYNPSYYDRNWRFETCRLS